MTQDDIIRMAREAGLIRQRGNLDIVKHSITQIERFAAIVAAHERETCAKSVYDSTDWAHEERDMVLKEAIAAAIRARSENGTA